MSIDCGATGMHWHRDLTNQTHTSCRPSTGRCLYTLSAMAKWEKAAIGTLTATKLTRCDDKFAMLNTIQCVTYTTI